MIKMCDKTCQTVPIWKLNPIILKQVEQKLIFLKYIDILLKWCRFCFRLMGMQLNGQTEIFFPLSLTLFALKFLSTLKIL